jgi:hypothetical protein
VQLEDVASRVALSFGIGGLLFGLERGWKTLSRHGGAAGPHLGAFQQQTRTTGFRFTSGKAELS